MKDLPDIPRAALRPPETVMRLERMGVMMPSRISFLPTILRALEDAGPVVKRALWDIDPEGYGTAVYTLTLAGHRYSLVAVSSPLDPDGRSDRVIAEAWDTAYVLFDGYPEAGDVARIAANAPLQEAGRFAPRDLVLSRANKSIRLWEHVVARLRTGGHPDKEALQRVGYLMRTTAVYGNGKFGIADRHLLAERPVLGGPFAAEMLTVWLIRQFTLDLVEHVGGAPLNRELARGLGIGNATGLGMAPFLVTHPVLLHNWMIARETAFARVLAVKSLSDEQRARLVELIARAAAHLDSWRLDDVEEDMKVRNLETEFASFRRGFEQALSGPSSPGDLFDRAAAGSVALQELMVALLLEPFDDLVDGLTGCMADPFGPLTAPFENTNALRIALHRGFGWALGRDYSDPVDCRRFWYVSAAKAEPRLGDRLAEQGAELEMPLDIARRVAALDADLPEGPMPVSAFLEMHPRHALAVQRVAMVARYPYGEIRDNLIAETCRPIDLLRAKLSFFGATRFDPKSDLWTRVTLAQGAPLADELGQGRGRDMFLR